MNSAQPTAIGQRRPHHLRPDARMHLRIFVQHHAAEIKPARGVGIVGAVEPDAGTTGAACLRDLRRQLDQSSVSLTVMSGIFAV